MKRLILADAGFLIGLADQQEPFHSLCQRLYSNHARLMLAPWPLYYEALRLKNLGSQRYVQKVVSVLESSPVQTIDDSPYRLVAAERLRQTRDKRAFSLVDWVLRLIILHKGEAIKSFLTVDPDDFSDVCQMKNVEIIDLKKVCV